jgi:hypothetical protein
MSEVDTSSYLKPAALPAQKTILDQVGQFQSLERGNIALGQDKLKQLNDQFNVMNAELSTLANDPNVTKEQAASRLITLSKTFGLKPEITSHMMNELNTAPDVKSFAQNALVRGMAAMEKVNNLYGTPSVYNQGQQDTPVNVSPMRGMRPTGLPIQRQIPPTQPVIGPDGTPGLQGPMAPVAPPGIATGPGQDIQPRPIKTLPIGPINNPAINGQSSNFGGNVIGATVEPAETPNQIVGNRFPAASGPATGYSPLFEEGKKAYTGDQLMASQKMMAAKPAIQALPLMQTPGFLSGPLTDQFTKVVAGLKSTGLIDIDENSDPTAIRQDVVKKLAQYVSNNPIGQRSDAAQTLREAASPNPNVQILPALIKLTKDAVALDRIEAAMPNAFKGKDYEDYLKHKGTFPQSIDEKAFTLDLEPEEKSKALVDKMAKQTKSKNNRERMEAEKFFRSLAIADNQGFYK